MLGWFKKKDAVELGVERLERDIRKFAPAFPQKEVDIFKGLVQKYRLYYTPEKEPELASFSLEPDGSGRLVSITFSGTEDRPTYTFYTQPFLPREFYHGLFPLDKETTHVQIIAPHDREAFGQALFEMVELARKFPHSSV